MGSKFSLNMFLSKDASVRTRFLHKVVPVSHPVSPTVKMSGPETWFTHSPAMMYLLLR